MKYKHLILFFLVALPVSVLIRVFQVFFTIDGTTGFFKPEYKAFGLCMVVLVLAIIAATVFISVFIRRCPPKMPRVKPSLGISSILLGLSILYETLNTSYAPNIPFWQKGLVIVFGGTSVVFFVAYGLKMFKNYHIKRRFYVVPVLYWMVKLIFIFTGISSLALISDNVFLVLSYCSALVFMLEYSKFANKIDVDMNYKKLFASGLAAVILCAVTSFPRFIAVIIGNTKILHESIVSSVTLFFTAVFIAAFIFNDYSVHNLKVKKRHHRAKTSAPGTQTDGFYIEDVKN